MIFMVRMKTIVCSKDDFQLVMVRMKTIVCSKDDFQLLCALRMIFNWIYSSCAPIWSLQCSCLPCVFSFRFLQICLFWSESQPRFSAHVQRCSCPAQSWSSFPPEFACFDLKRSWKVNIVAPVDRVPGPVYYRRLPGLLSDKLWILIRGWDGEQTGTES